jgi:hypothetical protein
LISSVSLPVAILASAMYGVFFLRGPVLRLVSSYVSTLFRFRAPASTAAAGPLAPLVGAVALVARTGAVLVCVVTGCASVRDLRSSFFVRPGARARATLQSSGCLIVRRALPVTFGCVLGVGCRSRRPAARVTQQTRVNTSQHMLPPPAEGLLTTKH